MDDFIELDEQSLKRLKLLLAFREQRTTLILSQYYQRAALRTTDMLAAECNAEDDRGLWALASLFDDRSDIYEQLILQEDALRLLTTSIEKIKTDLNIGS